MTAATPLAALKRRAGRKAAANRKAQGMREPGFGKEERKAAIDGFMESLARAVPGRVK